MDTLQSVPPSTFDRVWQRRGSDSLKWDGYAGRYGYSDPDLLPMWVADMDFPAPQAVREALEQTARKGFFGYPAPPDAYYRASVDWLQKRHRFAPDPDWLLPAPGVIPAVSLLIRAVSEPGDQILVQPPVYPNFYQAIRANNRRIAYNPLLFDGQRYTVDYADLERKAAAGARTLLLCSPHNPVGRVWTRDELMRIGEICLRHELFVISDEIHFDLTFSGQTHTVFQTLGDRFLHTSALLTSAGKTFNIPGLQPGIIVTANEAISERCFTDLKAFDFKRPNTCCQEAVIAAYARGEPWLDSLMRYIEANFRFLNDQLQSEMPEIGVIEPESTFLVWLDFRPLGLDSKKLERLLFEKARLVLNQGPEFGPGGEGFARMNIGCPRSVLENALDRLIRAVKG